MQYFDDCCPLEEKMLAITGGAQTEQYSHIDDVIIHCI